MDERTWNERVAASLEQMRRECAADRHEAEARMRQLLDMTDDFIRWQWQELGSAPGCRDPLRNPALRARRADRGTG
jgi:hypothetical protein